MPIASENARWSNTGTAANADENRKSQGSREHTGHEGENSSSPARTFESRMSQAV